MTSGDEDNFNEQEHESKSGDLWGFLLSPTAITLAVLSFAEGWLLSRQMRLLLLSAPFVFACFFFAVLTAQINDSELQLEQRYRNMLSESVMNEDRDAQESVLRSLVGLKPQDISLQLQLIDVLRSNGHVSESTKLLQPLLLTDSESSSAAHLLYAKYLIAEETAAAREQAVQQLVLADEKNPNNPAVLRLLARTLVKQGAITLGLKRFKQLAEADPIMGGLEYIKFLNLTGDLPSAQDTIDKAERELKLKTDTDTPAELDVLQLAQLYLLTNRSGEALTLLEDVLPRLNSRDVQIAYSEALVESARISLMQAESPPDAAVEKINTALQQNPASTTAIRLALALSLQGIGSLDSLDSFKAAESLCAAQLEKYPKNPELRLQLARIRGIQKRYAEAAELLKDFPTSVPTRPVSERIGFLWKSGQQDAARELVASREPYLEQHPEDRTAAFLHASDLVSIQRYADARKTLSRLDEPQSLPMQYIKLLGDAYLHEFDQRSGKPETHSRTALTWFPKLEDRSDAGALLNLLEEASKLPPVRIEVADRLLRIALSGGSYSSRAARALDEVRAARSDIDGLLSQRLGAVCLYAEQYNDAFRHLNLASIIQQGQSARTLNNLAIAIIRGKLKSPETAMVNINKALRLNNQFQLEMRGQLLGTRGEIYNAQKMWREARIDLEEALSLLPKSDRPEIHRRLAEALRGLGEISPANKQDDVAEQLLNEDAETSGDSGPQ